MKRMLGMLLMLLCIFVACRAQAQDEPARRALLIGCDTFISHENTVPSASLNVERMARMLQSDARAYASIMRMDTGIASLDRLRSVLETAFAEARESDVSLIYICTHGLYDRITREPSLVLSDGKTEETVSAAQLRTLLDTIPGQKVLLLDACNSGAFIGKGVWDASLSNSFASPDYKVLTSAGASESSFLWRSSDLGGSYFAEELCDGLRSRRYDLNADGMVTLSEAYQCLLENHGISTAHVYPQDDDFPLYIYDAAQPPLTGGPLSELMLDTSVLNNGEDTLYFSFTVRRAVRVYYQIIYYRNGQWWFNAPQIIEDDENSSGALSPGRKERSVTLVSEDDAPYGYVLLQLITKEGRYTLLSGSRLIAVQPSFGNPRLSIWCAPSFAPRTGEELSIYVRHAFPCSLTVTIRDSAGGTVRRLGYKTPSRPLGSMQEGSFFYWDGKAQNGEYVSPGEYTIHVSCRIGETLYEQHSGLISIGDR